MLLWALTDALRAQWEFVTQKEHKMLTLMPYYDDDEQTVQMYNFIIRIRFEE